MESKGGPIKALSVLLLVVAFLVLFGSYLAGKYAADNFGWKISVGAAPLARIPSIKGYGDPLIYTLAIVTLVILVPVCIVLLESYKNNHKQKEKDDS